MVAPTADIERLGYSPSEFAAAFGCTRQHVQNLIARGEIPSIKLGRLRRIPRAAVEALLSEDAAPDSESA
jgi:excisionase family DNA binding protein